MVVDWGVTVIVIYLTECNSNSNRRIRLLGYERVYLPLCEVADTPFHIQRDVLTVSRRVPWGLDDMCI